MDPSTQINAGDTAWVLVSAGLVMLMTPALAFFYGGMVRRKNILAILMKCFACLAIILVLWILYGYSLAFAPGNSFIGGMQWFGLRGVGFAPNPDYAATIPHSTFMIFQAMFAVITPAVIIGSLVERIKFSAFLVFMVLWLTFVYIPIAHMVWGAGGWLRNLGVLDFAGGTVVEINCGVAGLVSSLFLGRRLGQTHPSLHNLPFVVLGAGLLWFGWLGFNAGSALAANGVASNAFVTTNAAAAAAAVSWAAIEWITTGKPTIFGTVSGVVAGLVAITPACGYVEPLAAIFIGLVVGGLSFFAVGVVKQKFGYDDSLDAFGVHGIGGFWGMLATGLFATTAVNPGGANGLLLGNTAQFKTQIMAASITVVYCAIVTAAICFIVDRLIGMRVPAEQEIMGLDLTQHHERAYTILD
ncbi:MAG: ammonium transporter [Candidatus Omnitrophica bacterium]|nr:ammonium transporter [Candidatus Omnitrophota bacterium]